MIDFKLINTETGNEKTLSELTDEIALQVIRSGQSEITLHGCKHVVCRFTGVTDRGDKPVYEHDVVAYKLDSKSQVFISPVYWDQGNRIHGFLIEPEVGFFFANTHYLRVLGNLYDGKNHLHEAVRLGIIQPFKRMVKELIDKTCFYNRIASEFEIVHNYWGKVCEQTGVSKRKFEKHVLGYLQPDFTDDECKRIAEYHSVDPQALIAARDLELKHGWVHEKLGCVECGMVQDVWVEALEFDTGTNVHQCINCGKYMLQDDWVLV